MGARSESRSVNARRLSISVNLCSSSSVSLLSRRETRLQERERTGVGWTLLVCTSSIGSDSARSFSFDRSGAFITIKLHARYCRCCYLSTPRIDPSRYAAASTPKGGKFPPYVHSFAQSSEPHFRTKFKKLPF